MRFFIIPALAIAAIFFTIPFFTTTEFIYPVKLDSATVRQQQLQYEKEVALGKQKPGKIFLYHPRQLGLVAEDIIITSPDSVTLSCWYIPGKNKRPSPTLLILPDIKESKLSYIEIAAGLTELGINVCIADLRMQGQSGGSFYSMGKTSVNDVMTISEFLNEKYFSNSIMLMGTGTGAGIALQAAVANKTFDACILQNPFLNADSLLYEYASSRYGKFAGLFFKSMKRKLNEKSQFDADSLNLASLAEQFTNPVLLVSLITPDHLNYNAEEKLFHLSPALKKQWLVFNAVKIADDDKLKKRYFDSIAAFINSNVPKEKRKSKFNRLVYN